MSIYCRRCQGTKKVLNSMLTIDVLNLVNKGRKAHVLGLSLTVKNFAFDLLLLLNDSTSTLMIASVIYLRLVLIYVKYYLMTKNRKDDNVWNH